MGRVLQGPEGRLYGTTTEGGELDSGTVFSLALPPTASTSARENWSENVLYRFHSSNDGRLPQGDLTFDQAGNIYGTTIDGGAGCGMVYELTPSMGSWTETNLTPDCLDGVQAPFGGVVFDRAGEPVRCLQRRGSRCRRGVRVVAVRILLEPSN